MSKAAEILKSHRQRIDEIDTQIVALLRKRYDVIEEVSEIKLREGLHPVLQDRVDEVRNNAIRMAEEQGLDSEFIGKLYAQLIDHCCRLEATLMEAAKDEQKQERSA